MIEKKIGCYKVKREVVSNSEGVRFNRIAFRDEEDEYRGLALYLSNKELNELRAFLNLVIREGE